MTDITHQPVPRVSTGIAGLDAVLGGGFLRGGTYIVIGKPGTGKTILGNQVVFHHVAHGGRAVYVTLLAESHSRMLAHLGAMEFFDPSPIAASLTYVSGYRVLEQERLGGLLNLLRTLIRKHQATILVVDGLVSAEAFAPSELEFKKFIHELNALVGMIGCTTLLLTNGAERAVTPEHTMVDGLLELSDPLVGMQAVRELVVRKFRGSNHLRGAHRFQISDAGITVYPRIESILARPLTPGTSKARLGFGIDVLDRMIAGGLHSGSTTMVLGSSGSGKTTLGLNFLVEGAKKKQRAMLFGFFESPPRLVAKAESIGLRMHEHVEKERILLDWQTPIEQIPDALAAHLLERVRRNAVERLFIDGIGCFRQLSIYPDRIGRFFAALTNELRAMNVTTVYSQETSVLFGPGIEVPIEGMSATSDNILFLRQVEIASGLRRVLSVVKTRDTEHDETIREFEITPKGVVMKGPLRGAQAILTGIVALTGAPRGRARRK